MAMCKAAEEWKKELLTQGRAEGEIKGRAEGEIKGRAEGRAEGRKEGREEGRKEGRKEGRAEGRAEEKRSLAKAMKAEGLPAATIARISGLPEDEIGKL